ncbi:uncharacterized protein [Centruroides vittatus]|uniref:uncharacterized protein n=1 Tax=Centruroides vittatus TaxID=120091 RepID=UPI0035103291
MTSAWRNERNRLKVDSAKAELQIFNNFTEECPVMHKTFLANNKLLEMAAADGSTDWGLPAFRLGSFAGRSSSVGGFLLRTTVEESEREPPGKGRKGRRPWTDAVVDRYGGGEKMLFPSSLLVALFYVLWPYSSRVAEAKLQYRLVSSDTCDRYSLDALFHEKYRLITRDVFADSVVFVEKIIEKVEGSLQELIVQVPGHEKSSKEEMWMHNALTLLKDSFEKTARKLNDNITSQWETLIKINRKFLASERDVTFRNVVERVENVRGVYEHSKSRLDEELGKVVSFIKNLMRNSQKGIEEAAKLVSSHGHGDEISKKEEEDASKKKKSIIREILPPFMLKITERLYDRQINLTFPVSDASEERDSVLDDLCFSTGMIASKVKGLEHAEYSSQDYVDLTRRNLYILWANSMRSVYEDERRKKSDQGKIRSKDFGNFGRTKKSLWTH